MSFFQPIDTKHTDAPADNSHPLFLTLEEPTFRAFEPALSDAGDSAAFLQSSQPVFRSVGPLSLAMPAFPSSSLVTRSTYSGSEEDEEPAPAPAEDAASSLWNGTAASAAAAADSLSGASAVASLKSLSLPSVVSSAAEVAEAPAYYERSSFLSRAAPTDVLLALATVLESQLIDFQLSPQQHKIKGVVLANSVASHFVIRVWRQTSAHAYLVEFQRRSGCVVVFTNFYRACTAAISHLIVGSVSAPAVSTASVPFEVTLHASEPKSVPSSAGACVTGSVTLDDSSFQTLTAMACSGDAVSASEAMRVLSRAVASSPVNQRFVADRSPKHNTSQRTLDSLTATVRSSNSYLQMLAVQLASALVATVASSSSDSAPLREALLKLLPRSSSSSSSDLLGRETARMVRRCTDPAAAAAADKLALPTPSLGFHSSSHSKLVMPSVFAAANSLSSFHSLNESTCE